MKRLNMVLLVFLGLALDVARAAEKVPAFLVGTWRPNAEGVTLLIRSNGDCESPKSPTLGPKDFR